MCSITRDVGAGTLVKHKRKEHAAMSTPTEPQREHPSTYFVQDRSNEEELTRLQIQDQIVTTGMGGVLPEQPDPLIFQQVLDVGCGTGGWLMEAARTYPTMSLLVGVDVSSRMAEYARTQAEAQQVSDRVQFRSMDALRMLEFPSAFFDLVNQRFGASFLRTWDWPKLLLEFQRVTRPGGVIRVTESHMLASQCPVSSSVLPGRTPLYLREYWDLRRASTPVAAAWTSECADACSHAGISPWHR
jgi:ubiquinone/menaquinone biosynthesis C-methylase UbiE